jgi:hypothetical protein
MSICKQLNINVKPSSMETKQLNTNNIQSINDCIRRMLAEEKDLKALSSNTAFGNNIEVIKRTFRPCPCPTCPHQFSKMDIYHRLILIDSLYSTNINRMRSFGLEEMTDVIWNLCDDGNGNHSDAHSLPPQHCRFHHAEAGSRATPMFRHHSSRNRLGWYICNLPSP